MIDVSIMSKPNNCDVVKINEIEMKVLLEWKPINHCRYLFHCFVKANKFLENLNTSIFLHAVFLLPK